MGLNLIGSTIVWIIIIGGISFAFKKKIAKIFSKIPLPKFLLFLVIGIFYSLIEENINCPPTGCTLIPWTIPIFIAFILIHFGILTIFRIKNFYLGVLIFGLMGWIAEFMFGSHKEILWSSPIVTSLMSVWTILTYSIIIIVPVTILFKKSNKQ